MCREIERRRHPRIPMAGKEVTIRLRGPEGTGVYRGALRDLSCGGARCAVELPLLTEGSELFLEVRPSIWAFGRAVRIPIEVRHTGPAGSSYAFEFLVPQESREFRSLRRYVARAQRAREALRGSSESAFPLAEAFRMAQLSLPPHEKEGARLVLVTSAVNGEGKSLVASGMAAVLAQQDEPVLLVDCDLGNPSLHLTFEVSQQPGVAEWLEFASAATPRPITEIGQVAPCGVHVIAAGKAARPAKLLLQPAVRRLMDELRQSPYRYVVLNVPPLLISAGGALLAAYADDVLLAARSGVSRQRDLAAACTLLERNGAPTRGVVLTDHLDVLEEGQRVAGDGGPAGPGVQDYRPQSVRSSEDEGMSGASIVAAPSTFQLPAGSR